MESVFQNERATVRNYEGQAKLVIKRHQLYGRELWCKHSIRTRLKRHVDVVAHYCSVQKHCSVL